ncbi:ABC transporter substrate-binding protein [Brenneria tiliae]|uniref:ABC transporter substrate-binding protein n=1 Tax=Brenneria tiliae TaxID=2914984 RepID=UPI002014A3AF|nr:ABC transporter substrate-binding protein [Brenneria tiliae]MCL2899527.1 ABC transporter substrate-binding protein [Brenneria tiliae]MCL2903905.1 ABC transporter substrate-binding protein [Brenneria tiliae]
MLTKNAILIGALVAISGLFSVAAAQESVIKIGAAQTSAASLPIIVADQEGLLKAEGLSYERFDFKGGGPAIQALASGSVDACICAVEHAVRLQERGLGGKVLVSLADRHSYALLAGAGLTATRLADLKGQKIGITSAGSLTDTTVRYAIRQIGLDPDKDFSLIAVGRASAQRAAIQAGAISAGMFTTPDIQITLADSGKFKILEDYRTLAYPSQGLIVTDVWLEKNPQRAAALSRAITKALAIIHQDPQVLTRALKEMFPEVKDEALIRQIVTDVTSGYLSTDGVLSPASYATLGEIVRTVTPNENVSSYRDITINTHP